MEGCRLLDWTVELKCVWQLGFLIGASKMCVWPQAATEASTVGLCLSSEQQHLIYKVGGSIMYCSQPYNRALYILWYLSDTVDALITTSAFSAGGAVSTSVLVFN